MSLEEKLKKFYESKDFKQKVEMLSRNSKDFGNRGTHAIAEIYAQDLKATLRQEIVSRDIVNRDGVLFLDFIDVATRFVGGQGWTINLSFDTSKVMSKSLYSNAMDIYLPSLVNNVWKNSSRINGIHWGVDRHGVATWNSDKFMAGKYKGFIQSAVDKFKKTHNSCKVEISSVFDEGTI